MSTSTVQILIGQLDYTPYIPFETVHVDNNIVMTSDTCELNVEFNPDVDTIYNTKTSTYVSATRPKCGQEIIWQNPNVIITAPDSSQKPYREFAGVVTQVKETVDGVNLVYEVHANSYVHWFDRHLVTGWYAQQAPENIIKSMVQQYAPTFTTYNVQSTNVTVVPQYFDYRRLSESIKSIADQLEYGFYIDYYKDCHFMSLETFTSPLPNNLLDVDNDVQNYGDLVVEENGENVYNKIFIKGFKTRSSDYVVMPFIADGTTTQWSTGYRLSSVSGDIQVQVYPSLSAFNGDTAFKNGQAPTAGVSMTIAKDIVNGAPSAPASNNTAYIHFTQHLLRIPNYNNAGAVPANYVVAIRFHYMKDMVFLAQDPAASSATAALEGTDGVYEYAHSDKSLTNSTMNAVQAKGQLLLQKYKFPQISGQFDTFFNATNTTGWRAGQYFIIKSKRRFGGLNEVVFVQRVNKSIVKNDSGGLVTHYNVQFADSPYLV